MKIKWYTNACVRISSEAGTNILCDPWVNEGAFLGSWFHWPPIPSNFEEELIEENCDGIYISHLHPDHYDPKFIAKFSRNRPEVPIYIAEFAHSWLRRSVARVVSKETSVIELPALKEIHIKDDLSLQVFPADTCNPNLCGVNVPCVSEPSLRGIDSIGVFYADGIKVVNANDAMGVHLVPRIAANIGKADLLMGHYGGASPYPQCFIEIDDYKKEALKVVNSSCQTLLNAANALEVKEIMPFAGQYVLGGKLVSLNEYRATIPLDEAVKYLQTLTERDVVSVQPGGEIDLTSGTQDPKYVEPDASILELYLNNIEIFDFPYENGSKKRWESVSSDLMSAAQPILDRSKGVRIGLENSFVIGDGVNSVTINLDPAGVSSSVSIGNKPSFNNITYITMSTELLRRLSTRRIGYKGFTPLHWNQADVGSHFKWKRIGTYDLQSHMLLNFFGI